MAPFDPRALPAGITDLIPDIQADVATLFPTPAATTREDILAERRTLAGLPGFEPVDYDKQAAEDRRLMLGLAGLKAAQAAFAGMSTRPIPGEKAVSTWLRGSVGPATGAIAPYAYDFMKRKRERAAQARADKQALSKAAITTVQGRKAAAAAQDLEIAKLATGLAADQFGKYQDAVNILTGHAHEITMEGLAHTSKVKIANLTASSAAIAAELLGETKLEQIRETAIHAGDRLTETISARTSEGKLDRDERLRIHEERLVATADESAKERLSREFQAGEDRRAAETRLFITQKFEDEQRGLRDRFQAVEGQFNRAQEKALALAREAGSMTRHREDIETKLDVSGLDRASREALSAESLKARADENRLNNAHSDAVALKDRLAADMNERIKAMEAYRLAAAKASWGYDEAIDVQTLRNAWDKAKFDRYLKGTTEKVHLTLYGAAQMGFSPEDAKGLVGKDFSLTYHYPKPGFASDVVKPYIVISGQGKTFNSLQYDPETGGGKNVVPDPTLMVTGRGEAEANKLYENTSDREIELPLGSNIRKVAPGAGVMLTNWEHQYMDEEFKAALIETDATTLARHRARTAGIRSSWEQALGRDEADLSQAQMNLSFVIPRYEGGLPLFQEFANLMHAATGIRGKMNIKDAREEATEFINALKNSIAWKNQDISTVQPITGTQIQAGLAAQVIGDEDEPITVEGEPVITPRPSPQDAPPKEFFEGLRERNLVARERSWDQLSMLEQRAFEALPRGLPEGYNKRVITKNWEEQITRLEDIRAKYDDSMATPRGIQAATSLATVKGLLEILHNEKKLLNRTGRFVVGAISGARKLGADIPGVGSEAGNYLAKVFADLETHVGALAKAQGMEGRNFVTQFNAENLRELLPKLHQQEAINRNNVESALRLVTNAMEAYRSPQVQEGFIIPEAVAATFLAMGVDIGWDISRYPFMKATNPDPLVTMKDLDPEGIIKRELTPAIVGQLRQGQKIDYEIRGKYGWYKTGEERDQDGTIISITVRHPDDPDDLEDQVINFKAKVR